MLQHLSRASVRANASLVASRKISAVRLASTQTLDTSTEKPKALLTAFIRTWRPPTGVPEALLILAEIEKKYGKIRESHFLKDYEMLQKYQMLAYIVFEDTQSLQRIPRGGIDHAVESRSQDEGEPYDISLQDVEALLYPVESATTSSATASADKDKVLGFRLTPADRDYVDPKNLSASGNRIFQATPGPVMENFYKWGGFHSEEPLELPSKQFSADELFNSKEVQPNIRMQAALKLCQMNRKQGPLLSGSGVGTMKRPQQDSPAPTSAATSESADQPPLHTPVRSDAATIPSKPATTGSKAEKSASVTPPLHTPPPPPPPPVPEEKKPELSQELQDALATQLKAARELKKSAAAVSKIPSMNIPPSLALPTRRKQAKPRPVRTYVEINKASPEADSAKEEGGILGKLWSFVGRK